MIRFQCPTCGKVLKVDEQGAGRQVTCPKCNARVIVPPPVRQPAVIGKAVPDPEPEVSEDVPPDPAIPEAREPDPRGRAKGEGEKYCHECGAVIRARAVVCPACGVPQGSTGAAGPYYDPNARPGKVTGIGIMLIVAGGAAVLGGLILAGTFIGLLWPGTYYAFFVGVWTIIDGISVLNQPAGRGKPPKLSCILHIVNIINGNLVSLVLGIICLVQLADPQVKEWYGTDG